MTNDRSIRARIRAEEKAKAVEAELTAMREKVRRYEEALRPAAAHRCERYDACLRTRVGDAERMCASCMARAALKGETL